MLIRVFTIKAININYEKRLVKLPELSLYDIMLLMDKFAKQKRISAIEIKLLERIFL